MPVIATNLAANTTLRYLNRNSDEQTDNLARIASGSRITKASDDASGLAIGTKLATDVNTLTQAQTNVANGASVLAVADGGMASISDILSRMKTLAAQSVSGTVTDTERGYIQVEMAALISEIDSTVAATTFNGAALLDGTFAAVNFLGGNAATDVISVSIDDVDAAALGVAAADVSTAAGATTALGLIDTAIGLLSTARAEVGAQMSRFEFRSAMLATSVENTDAATSAIMDADVAAEQAELASNEVKTQAAIAALAQANQLPQQLLDLLR